MCVYWRVCQCKRHTLTQKVFHCASLSGIASATSTCVAREPAYACMVAALQLRLISGKWHMRLLQGCRTLYQQHPGTISLPLRFFWIHATNLNILLAIMSRNWLTLTCLLPLKIWRLCEYTTVTTDESLGNAKATFRKRMKEAGTLKSSRIDTRNMHLRHLCCKRSVFICHNHFPAAATWLCTESKCPNLFIDVGSIKYFEYTSHTVPGAIYQKVGWGIESPAWVEKDLLTLLTWECKLTHSGQQELHTHSNRLRSTAANVCSMLCLQYLHKNLHQQCFFVQGPW